MKYENIVDTKSFDRAVKDYITVYSPNGLHEVLKNDPRRQRSSLDSFITGVGSVLDLSGTSSKEDPVSTILDTRTSVLKMMADMKSPERTYFLRAVHAMKQRNRAPKMSSDPYVSQLIGELDSEYVSRRELYLKEHTK
ncbi:MAG: hypothetical protein ACI83O_000549 [Patescibacteria group bacterium]|jgi:hypothetical protein